MIMTYKLIPTTYAKMLASILSFILVFTASIAFSTSTVSANEIAAPTNLKVVDYTHNSVTLSWDLVDGVSPDDGYNVWNGNTGDWMAWTAGPTHLIGGLKPETAYSFYVTPGKENNKKSNIVTVTTKPADPNARPKPPLTPPHQLKITDITDNSVSLSWGTSPEATGYDIYVNGAWSGGTWSNSVTNFTYSNVQAVTGAVYTFTVGAQNTNLNPKDVSAKSNAVTIKWGQLEAPQDLKVVTATRTSASLGWAPTPGAASYDIYMNNALVGSSESNRYVATGLTEGQSYLFKVVAKNRLWESPASSEVTVVPGSNYNIVTYYTSWSIYERKFEPSNIDASQITHINYAFADLCWDGYGSGGTACKNDKIPLQGEYVFDGEMVIGDQEADVANLSKLRTLRDQYPHLNLMVSVGGWSWSKNFSNMAATEGTRRAFANSTVDFLREYRLDGLDIDWEYPVEGGDSGNSNRPEDKENFVLLMKTVREALDAAGSEDGRYYLLTIASAQSDAFVVNADLGQSSAYLDFINIMTYDYSGNWESIAHHNAPLYYDKNHPKPSAARNHVTGSIIGHLNGAVPNYKLVMGLPFFGKGWIGCPPNGQYQICAGGQLPAGEKFGTWEDFKFDYSDIEDNYLNKNGYVRYWNEAAKVPYLYNAAKQYFITYDDEESMMYKASLMKSLDLAGVMSWEISGDRNRTLSAQLVRDLPIHGSVNGDALAVPTNLAVKSSSSSTIQITWNAPEKATGYDVFVDNIWVGYAATNQYTLTSLLPSTSYKIRVIAVQKEGEQLKAVSISSQELNAKTSESTSTNPGGSGNSGDSSGTSSPSTPSTPTVPNSNVTGDPLANQLKTTVTKDGDKIIVKLQTAEAIQSIQNSTAAKTQIAVGTEQKKVEIIIPKEVIQAIAAKKDTAVLSIVVNQVEYSIPVKALRLGENITELKISIQSPEQGVIDQFLQTAQANGIKVLMNPLEFKMEGVTSSRETTEIADFGSVYASRIFKLNHKDIHTDRATGIVYIPDKKELRHVPTTFTNNSDGTVTAELKRPGNSIYAIVEANASFQDATAAWYKKDVESAASKFIASGVSRVEFGISRQITRAEFVSIIVRALGITPATERSPFSDVTHETKFAEDIIAASQLGFIKGKSANTFDPAGLITRQEMAVVLEKAMNFAGLKKEADLQVLNKFEDQAKISPYAKTSLAFVVEQHIMNGGSATKLDPLSHVTKAQATVTAMRMLRALKLVNS